MAANTAIAEGFWQTPGKVRSIEWYTPPWIFQALGLEFDLDPCHPAKRLPWVPARRTIDRLENGLLQPWHGRVWLNPPYGKETGQWCSRLAEHGNGIALVFSRTDCTWFHEAIAKADAILFLRGRIAFVDGSGTGNAGAGAGSLLAAYGKECTEALFRLSDRGFIFRRPEVS